MANPNLVTVYDKEGTPFEVSRANAVDLVQVDGWTFSKPVVKVVKESEEPEDEYKDEDENEDENQDENEADVLFTTVEEFELFPTREAVVEYLAENFPDYRPHHLSKREKLVADAIDLATAGE